MDDKTEKRVLTDRLEIIIIELPKVKRIYGKNTENKILQWMMFLDNPNKEEVIQIMGVNKDIKKAIEELEQVSGDAKLQRIAELRQKAIWDENAALAYASDNGYKLGLEKGQEEGMKEGIEKGIEKNQLEIVKNMLNENMDLEFIERVTKLKKDKIEKIKELLNEEKK